MKYAATMGSSDTGLWLVLAMLLTSLCAGKPLSLYRVDGNEGNVKRQRAGHLSAPSNASTIANESPKESYVKAAVVHPTEKDAKYRSEEAKLQQERRLMFFRNLQFGSMSQSIQSMSMSMGVSGPTPPASGGEATYQIDPPGGDPTTDTWQVLDGASQSEGAYIDPPTETDHDAELLDELIKRAEAFAGTEHADVKSAVLDETDEGASPSVQDGDMEVDEGEATESEQATTGGEGEEGEEEEEDQADEVDEGSEEEQDDEDVDEASPPAEIKAPQVQLRGGLQKIKGAKKAPKRAKGKKNGKKGKKGKHKKGKKKKGAKERR